MRDLGVTFAGGGNRAFYQMGLWHRWGDRLMPRVAAFGSVSAGACVITTILSGRWDQAREYWTERRAHVTKNFQWSRVLKGKSPAPHGPIFYDTLIHTFIEGGLERVKAAPFPVWVLTAQFPDSLPPSAAVFIGLSGYSIEKKFAKARVHPEWGKAMGFAPYVVDARDCNSPEELSDLIIASSSTPPFTPVGNFRGKRLLDGGMVDNVPAFIVEEHPDVRRNLIVLTRPYPTDLTGHRGSRLYIGPSVTTPVNRWDYTAPQKVWATVAMGEREADLHAPALDAFLAP